MAAGLAWACIFISTVVLVGWLGNITLLKSLLPGWPTMKVNTAACTIMTGIAILAELRGRRRLPAWLAMVVVVVAAVTLYQYAAGVDLGLDQLLARDPLPSGGSLPGRMSAVSALSLALLALGILTGSSRSRLGVVASDAGAVLVVTFSFATLAGYLYGFGPLRSLGPGVATLGAHTAVVHALMAVALLAARPQRGIAGIVLDPRAGGRFALNMLPAAFVVPLIAGWFRVVGQNLGYFDQAVGVVSFLMIAMAGFVAATGLGAYRLNAVDGNLLELNRELENRVAERTRQLEQALAQAAQSEAFAADVLDSLAASVAVLDDRARIIRVNRTWRGTAPESSDGYLGQDYLAACEGASGNADDGAAAAACGIRAVLAGEDSLFTLEYPCDRPDGSREWFVMRVAPLSGVHGGAVVVHQDITARKRLELEAMAATDLLQRTGRSARIGGWELQLDPPRLRWTDETFAIHELDPSCQPALEGAIAFYAPEARPQISAAVEAGMAEGRPWNLELPFVTAKGRAIWVNAVGEAVREGGRLVALRGTIQDITNRKTAELRLAASEASYRAMFEANPQPMFIYDPVTLRFMAANAAALGHYGWSEQEFQAMTFDELFPVAEVNAIRETVATLVDGRPGTLAGHNRTRDGRTIEVEISGHGVRFEGVAARMSIVNDVTARNAFERDLRARNAELERFTYTVSHDLKAPLVTIRTFADYLEQDLAAGNREKVNTDLGFVRGAAGRMSLLLDDLLHLSRVGRASGTRTQTTFQEVVAEALRMTAGSVVYRGVAVDIDPADEALLANRSSLLELWVNLIDNAVKYMGDEPDPWIHLGVRHEPGGPVFFVEDNGIGIEPRHGERVFGLFEKLDRATPGTGVGLALVRRIAELNGGQSWIESPSGGRGTRVCFTLPNAVQAVRTEDRDLAVAGT